MVKLERLPHANTVLAFKRKVDFYTWKGVAVARAWPQWTLTERAPAVYAQHPWLKAANAASERVGYATTYKLKVLQETGTWTWRDRFMTQYFGTAGKVGDDPARDHAHPPHFPYPDPLNHYWFTRGSYGQRDGLGHPYIYFYTNDRDGIALWVSGAPPASLPITRTRRGIDSLAGYHFKHSSFAYTAFLPEILPYVYRFDIDYATRNTTGNQIFFIVQGRHIATNHSSFGATPTMVTPRRLTNPLLNGQYFYDWAYPNVYDPEFGRQDFGPWHTWYA